MVFDESFDAIADCNYVSFLDEVSVVPLEESLRGGGLISQHTFHHGHFETIAGLLDAMFCTDDFHVDVVSATLGF